MRTLRLPVLALTVAVLAVAGCSGASSASDQTVAAPAAVDQIEGRTIIDVRTPEEFAEGHVEGATNLDLQSGQFEAALAQLPSDGSYFLYCRTGNRSGQAEQLMRDRGFDDVVNGGGFDDLRAAGVPTA
jgi:phage shock protein E